LDRLFARATGTLLVAILAAAGTLARDARAALGLGRRGRNRDLAGGRGLARDQRLRLVFFLFFDHRDRFRFGRRSGRMELAAQVDDQALFFVGLYANQAL